jgi:hypothetical protein
VKPPTPAPFPGDTISRYDGQLVDVRWPAEWKTVEGWRPYNPSLAWHQGRLFMTARYSFFAFPGLDTTGHVLVSSNYYGRSETLFAELDPTTLQVLRWAPLTYHRWVGSRNTALEDVRIWSDETGLYGIGVFLPEDSREKPSQAIIRIDPNRYAASLTRVFPSTERAEKNWSPIQGRPEFTYSPTQHVNDGQIVGEPYGGRIHGGTPLIEHGDGYLSVVHHFTNRPTRTNRRGGGRHYVHHFAYWDKDLHLTHLTAPFVFAWESAIEFAAGLVRHNDRLLISIGWGDWDMSLYTVNPDRVDAALEPFGDEARFLIGRR